MSNNNNPEHVDGSNSSSPSSSSSSSSASPSLFFSLSAYSRFHSQGLNPTMMSSNNPQHGNGSNSSKPSSFFQSLSSYNRFRLSRSQRIPSSSSSSSSSSDSFPYSVREISSAVENTLSSIPLGLCSIERCTLGNRKIAIFSLHIGSHQKPDLSPSHLSTLTSRSHHPSLYKLLGASNSRAGGRIYMVYEDFPDVTLKKCLQTSDTNLLSNWILRMQVALDLAQGLEYIHHHCGMVHGMIMSSTVAVTEPNSNACICLFGANDFRKWGIDGPPIGFAAPEFLEKGKISQKSDVYAFGVVILELVSGKAAREWEEDEGILLRSLVEIARHAIVGREGEPEHEEIRMERVMEFVDWQLHDSFPMETAESLIKVALKCVEDVPDLRPEMTSVAEDIRRLFLASKDWQTTRSPTTTTLSLSSLPGGETTEGEQTFSP